MKNNPLQPTLNTSVSFSELLNTDVTFFGKATYSDAQAAQEMIYKINAEAEQAQAAYRKTKTIKSTREYLKWLQKLQEHFANEKQKLLERSYSNIQETIDYKTVEANLQKVITEITAVETDIKEKLNTFELNESFTLVMEEIISKLEGDNKTVDDSPQVTKTIQAQLQNLQQQLPWNKISLSSENEHTLATLIQIKIAEHAKPQVTSLVVKKAFREIKNEFLKTTVPADRFYWPGDIAIAPDGQIMELPDARLDFYSMCGVRPLLLHREEFSKPEIIETTKNYISERQAKTKNLHIEAANFLITHFQKNNNIDIFGDDKDIVNNIPRNQLKEAELQIANRIQERLNMWLTDPQSLLLPTKILIEKSPAVDPAVLSIRQQIITVFSKHNSDYSLSYLKYVANIPNSINTPFAIFCNPTEPFFERIEIKDDQQKVGGTSQSKTNTICISGFKHIEILPGLFADLQLYPRPSIYGGIFFENTQRYEFKYQSHASGHALQQVMIQELRDLVHGKLGVKIDKEKIAEFNLAVDKSKVLMIRIEVLANKIIKGAPLDRTTTQGLPDKVINHSRYPKVSLKELQHMQHIKDVTFNETEEWHNLKKYLKDDFSAVKQEPRYVYIPAKLAANTNVEIGQVVDCIDPWQKILVEGVVTEIGTIVNGEIPLKIRLPDITDLEKIYAYILRELADNMNGSILDVERAAYAEENIPFEILGRMGEVFNKFKSVANYAVKFMESFLEKLNNTIDKELINQFFENAGYYLQELQEQNETQDTWNYFKHP